VPASRRRPRRTLRSGRPSTKCVGFRGSDIGTALMPWQGRDRQGGRERGQVIRTSRGFVGSPEAPTPTVCSMREQTEFQARPARRDDAGPIARIYDQGIEDRVATFETTPRTEADVLRWFDAGLPIVVIEDADGDVIAWASARGREVPAPWEARRSLARLSDRRTFAGRGRAQHAHVVLATAAGRSRRNRDRPSSVDPDEAGSRCPRRRDRPDPAPLRTSREHRPPGRV
jgi:hypothetical protein